MKKDDGHVKSDEELKVEIDQQRRHLYDLKSQAVTEKIEDPTQLRKTRRNIARLLTETRSRQLKNTETTKS